VSFIGSVLSVRHRGSAALLFISKVLIHSNVLHHVYHVHNVVNGVLCEYFAVLWWWCNCTYAALVVLCVCVSIICSVCQPIMYAFTLLYPNINNLDEVKEIALKACLDSDFDDESQINALNSGCGVHSMYSCIKKNYMKVMLQLEGKKLHDFLRLRRRFAKKNHAISEFCRFKLVATLDSSGPTYELVDGMHRETIETKHSRCPFCNMSVPVNAMTMHLKEAKCGQESSATEGKVTVLFDKGVKTEYEQLVFDAMSVRMLKRMVYDRTGVSVSKQTMYRGDTALKNDEIVTNETIVLRQKRREQR
jgi:hypothetical protein